VLLAVLLTTLLGYAGATSAASDVGYRDFSFNATSVVAPTGEKPQSKLWFNDGTWWASMFNRTAEEYHIYRYDHATHTWGDTGTLIDERNNSKADTLWDGSHLYVATAGACTTCSPQSARILRYSYDAVSKRYSLDPGFPVTGISNGGMEAIVLEKDTTGKLWVTYTQKRKVYVNRSLSTDQTWGTPFVLPVNGTSVSPDDISAVVAFDSQIGVMWSNQVDSAMYFATHTDGDADDVWQASRTAIQGPNFADDHISLRSLQVDDVSGRVFAAVKTSLNDVRNPNPNAPLIFLLARDQDGNWTNHVFGRVGDNHTRPIVMIDEEHRDLYMFASAPCCDGGAIYYKKTALANISFPEGVGTPFIQSATDTHINDATSTKQNVNSDTGLLVQASDDTSQFYVHNFIDLSNTSDTTPPETTIDSGPSGTVNSSSASFAFSSTEPDSTFECALDGASFSGCNSSQNYTELSDGSHTFQVRATDTASNTDTTPAERSWTVDTTGTVDTTAPLVESVTPADGAMNVAVANNIEASFSEAMDASTLTTSTFTLLKQDSTTTPVEAAVSYDSANKKATLDPASDLEANTSYTARVTGGSSGAKDLAGNALAQDYSWTFITASPPAPSCTITGTANAETISGTSSDDVICAGGGNDTINGLGGNDTLKGEAGGDTLLGDVGNDTLDGGLGIADTASYSVSLTAVTASLVTNSATGEGSDTFLGVENLIGSSQADTLTGSDTNNRLTGRGGPDTEQGGLGNDTVVGSGGADSLYGEDGDDTVNSQDSVSGNDSLDGGGGTDTAVTDATEKSIVNFP
jgi:Ca2+-binding RTX toxin-like protein